MSNKPAAVSMLISCTGWPMGKSVYESDDVAHPLHGGPMILRCICSNL